MSTIWMKNAIPRSYTELQEQRPDLTRLFDMYLRTRQVQHMIFIGHEGIGKTTFALRLAEAILYDRTNLKVVYANDPITKEERDQARHIGEVSGDRIGSGAGVNRKLNPFVHVRILPFASSKPYGGDTFKILIIKNFDALGNEQQSFRRIMEQYSANCRFILITSRLSQILNPIVSRCSVHAIMPMLDDQFDEYLLEQIQTYVPDFEDTNALIKLRQLSNKNIGYALTLAQQTYEKFNMISLRSLESLVVNPKQKQIEMLIQYVMRKQLGQAIQQVQILLKSTYISLPDFFSIVMNYLITLPLSPILYRWIDFTANYNVFTITNSDVALVIRTYLLKITQILEEEK